MCARSRSHSGASASWSYRAGHNPLGSGCPGKAAPCVPRWRCMFGRYHVHTRQVARPSAARRCGVQGQTSQGARDTCCRQVRTRRPQTEANTGCIFCTRGAAPALAQLGTMKCDADSIQVRCGAALPGWTAETTISPFCAVRVESCRCLSVRRHARAHTARATYRPLGALGALAGGIDPLDEGPGNMPCNMLRAIPNAITAGARGRAMLLKCKCFDGGQARPPRIALSGAQEHCSRHCQGGRHSGATESAPEISGRAAPGMMGRPGKWPLKNSSLIVMFL